MINCELILVCLVLSVGLSHHSNDNQRVYYVQLYLYLMLCICISPRAIAVAVADLHVQVGIRSMLSLAATTVEPSIRTPLKWGHLP